MTNRLNVVAIALAAGLPVVASAQTSYLGVAAGDADSTSAVLWTRATDGTTNPIGLTAQVSTDPNFGTIDASYSVNTDPANRDSVAKFVATGLNAGTNYYYRFVSPGNVVSGTGKFKTTPDANARVGVKFGFSGDCDGQWRPYSSIRNLPGKNLDAFINLGDTIYETASTRSAAAVVPSATNNNLTSAQAAQITTDYRRKYREQFETTTSGGFTGLKSFFAGQANYTLLDNHELGNRQYINGGAPANAINGDTDTSKDVNTTGTYMNKTAGFGAFIQAYKDYQPIRETTVSAPSDARSDGTLKMYDAHQWGKNVSYIQVDDRSYRDIRLKTAGNVDDTGPRGTNVNRTMLGTTQLNWVKQQLSDAQANGTVWKVLSVSSPIDQIGAFGSGLDGGKSWITGYRAERNNLLKYIADNNITNVIFLSTDDHQSRANELGYFDDINNQATYHRMDRVYSIVAGPIGAGGPDGVTNHSFANISNLATGLFNSQVAAGVDPVGLDANNPYLFNVRREGHASANAERSAVDFFSPDTFNYALLNFSADGSTLDVSVEGINSYAPNSFPEPGATSDVREIFGFSLSAVPAPSCVAIVGLAGVFASRRRRLA
jgi:phosphodiesterase/alkaline phosphatase D-like protein